MGEQISILDTTCISAGVPQGSIVLHFLQKIMKIVYLLDTTFISAEVPQGSILGPLLFVVFIDDLASYLKNDLHLFAADSTLHIVIKSTNDRALCAESLQQYLNNIETWASSWYVTFNASKTEEMIISRKRDQNHPLLYFMKNKLEPTGSITFVGVTISNTLSWAQHIRYSQENSQAPLHLRSCQDSAASVSTYYRL